MKRVLTKIFSVPDTERSWWSVVVWWELRRIPYNLIVGLVGLVNLMAFGYINDVLLRPYLSLEERDWEPFAAIFFGLVANIFYTGGWVTELFVRGVTRRNTRHFGLIAFSVGLGFSVAITFLPPLLDGIRWVWFATHKSP